MKRLFLVLALIAFTAVSQAKLVCDEVEVDFIFFTDRQNNWEYELPQG